MVHAAPTPKYAAHQAPKSAAAAASSATQLLGSAVKLVESSLEVAAATRTTSAALTAVLQDSSVSTPRSAAAQQTYVEAPAAVLLVKPASATRFAVILVKLCVQGSAAVGPVSAVASVVIRVLCVEVRAAVQDRVV